VLRIYGEQGMANFDHEEADSRIVLYIIDALERGAKKILICMVDTDVIVILIGQFYNIVGHYPNVDLWIAFGTGKHFRYYSINGLVVIRERTITVSLSISFLVRPRKQHGLHGTFIQRSMKLLHLCLKMRMFKPTTHRQVFVCWSDILCYFMTKLCTLKSVNEAYLDLFCKKNKSLEYLPPTRVIIRAKKNDADS